MFFSFWYFGLKNKNLFCSLWLYSVKIVPNMTYNVFGGTLNPTLLKSV